MQIEDSIHSVVFCDGDVVTEWREVNTNGRISGHSHLQLTLSFCGVKVSVSLTLSLLTRHLQCEIQN